MCVKQAADSSPLDIRCALCSLNIPSDTSKILWSFLFAACNSIMNKASASISVKAPIIIADSRGVGCEFPKRPQVP
jgi:hypothetical protein